MNCIHFEDWLRDTVGERDRTVSAEAAAHLDCCPTCRARWAGELRLERAIDAWSAAPFPALSADTVLLRLSAIVGAAGRSTWSGVGTSSSLWRAWVSIAAAVMVLAATAVALRLPHASLEPTARVEHSSPAIEVPAAAVSESVALLWSDLQAVSRAVAEETVTSLTQLPAVPPAIDPPDRQPAVASPTWLPFSEPFGAQVHSGFGFLTEALPRPPAG